MGEVQGIAAAGKVAVAAPVAVFQAIVGGVVDASKAQGGATVVALRGVVVHDVEDDLDARLVKALDHGLELADLLAAGARGGEAGVRREVADGIVAPIVVETAILEGLLGHGVVHGQELQRGDPETREVLEGGWRGEPGVGAAKRARDIRMTQGESLDVHFVDDRLVPRRAQEAVPAPREGGLDDDALGQICRAVARIGLARRVRLARTIAAHGVVPVQITRDGPGIRIEHHLGRIEAMALRRLIGAVHAVAVEVARARLGKIDVPDLIGALGHGDAGDLTAGILRVEEAEIHRDRVLAEEGEVHAGAVPGGAERVGPARASAEGAGGHGDQPSLGESHTAARGGRVSRTE